MHSPHSNEPDDAYDEVAYTKEYLAGKTKNKLTQFIQRQHSQWPLSKFNPSRTTVGEMKKILLDPAHGFTHQVQATAGETGKELAGASVDEATDGLVDHNNKEVIVANPVRSPPGYSVGGGCSEVPAFRETGKFTATVFVEDHRTIPSRKFTVDISLFRLEDTSCSGGLTQYDDHIFIRTNELVFQVLRSPFILPGAVAVGWPYPSRPDFIQHFFAGSTGASLDEMDCSPVVLSVSPATGITIHIEPDPTSSSAPPLADIYRDDATPTPPATTESRADTAKPLELANLKGRAHGKGKASTSRSAKLIENQEVIVWLKGLAAVRDKDGVFSGSKNKRLKNPQVVETWKFAATFLHDFHDAIFTPASKSDSEDKKPQKVTRADIRIALDVEETWMLEATRATDFISKYSERPEVLAELMKDTGRYKLYKFLCDFDSTEASDAGGSTSGTRM
ncbi:hypothetical protein BDN72DRAFT_906348 [Pluteus cervinus]|uniref:Uncharacterized protein n=1 Tax=Pluteus cervinus TaxID=181527 RepID=A0ACD3A0B7_9AGAR|nr:hypothetical protein BDN72DRAFT_906348 [Pluteus cervinus]